VSRSEPIWLVGVYPGAHCGRGYVRRFRAPAEADAPCSHSFFRRIIRPMMSWPNVLSRRTVSLASSRTASLPVPARLAAV
jgi:hypothetical protein